MEQENLRNIIALHQSHGIGSMTFFALLEYFQNDFPRIFASSSSALAQAGLNKSQISGIKNNDWNKVDAALMWAEGEHHQIISCLDENYPPLLNELPDKPALLYLSGNTDLLNSPQIALVGSRTATPTGIQTARHFSSFLAKSGLTITSGMALGIDTASHQGALDVGGKTIAVTGTGLDRIYPSKNKALAYQIFEHGLLVSEYALGTAPARGNFPRRNRIISGLSVGTLVIEATEKSGSLITAYQALDYGREVFAIPGSIHNPHAKGCHQLIKHGAKLVDKASDITEELASLLGFMATLEKPKEITITNVEELDADYQQLLNQIGYEAISIDEIVYRSGLTIDKVSSMLLILELKDHINTAPGGLYVRTSTRFS